MTDPVKALLTILTIINIGMHAQSVTNGDFSANAAGWGCSPEVNTEGTYGGSGSNPVDEVDAAATLCQTISGFTPGNDYYIALDASRRTGGCPGPVVTNVDITVSGGVLATTITRTNTTFGFVTQGFRFTANSASHTITFSAGIGFGGSTCGMIVDNIVIVAAVLPITLLNFDASANAGSLTLLWSTATEKNNHYFEVERSTDGINFEAIALVNSKASAGNSLTRLDYSAADPGPVSGLAYYRLKQTDLDKTFSYSKLIQINSNKKLAAGLLISPNPNKGSFTINFPGLDKNNPVEIDLYDAPGSLICSVPAVTDVSSSFVFDPGKALTPGYYNCVVTAGSKRYYTKVIVE